MKKILIFGIVFLFLFSGIYAEGNYTNNSLSGEIDIHHVENNYTFGIKNIIFLFTFLSVFGFWYFIYYQISRYKIAEKHQLIVLAEQGFIKITKLICWAWFIFCFYNIHLVFSLGSDAQFSEKMINLINTMKYATITPFLIYSVYFTIKYPLSVKIIKKSLRGIFYK